MALNKQSFQTRTLTAVVFVAVMAAGLFWNVWSFFVLFSLVHFGAWAEYVGLIKKFNADVQPTKNWFWITVAIAGWCALLYFSNYTLRIGFFTLTEGGFWVGMALLLSLPLLLLLQRTAPVKAAGYAVLGLVYISLPLALLMDLRTRWADAQGSLNFTLPLLVIFTLWVNDTMAYIVGSFIGKTKLSAVSPNKTWEGTVGGAVLAVVVISAAAVLTGRLPLVHAVIMSLLAAVFGTLGDLAESRLKRLAGVKDSGAVMPGHGGYLDRFDSLLFAVVPVWFYAVLVLRNWSGT